MDPWHSDLNAPAPVDHDHDDCGRCDCGCGADAACGEPCARCGWPCVEDDDGEACQCQPDEPEIAADDDDDDCDDDCDGYGLIHFYEVSW